MTKQEYFTKIREELINYTYSNGAFMAMPDYALEGLFTEYSETCATYVNNRTQAKAYLNEFVQEGLLKASTNPRFNTIDYMLVNYN